MAKNCTHCWNDFEISELESVLREKISPRIGGVTHLIPEPTLCSTCRRQRRYAFRNDTKLYRRQCDKTGKATLSIFRPDVNFPVYSQEAWWADDWDPRDYGRDFDFSRPFFEQFAELMQVVPRLATIVVQSENSDYSLFAFRCRNCYLSARLADNEDIYYSYLAMHSNTCFDCHNINHCELCYECVDLKNCYRCAYTECSENSNDLWFCKDMRGCKDCFGCIGLVQKQYYFFNEACSKEEYEAKVAAWMQQDNAVPLAREALAEHAKKYPVRAITMINCERSQGGYLFDSKNTWASFDAVGCEDTVHSTQVEYCKDSVDADFSYKCELMYEHLSGGTSQRCCFTLTTMGSCSELMYCMDSCNGAQNSFGCISLRKAEYCILNKQYSKEEYEALMPRIIEHMKSTGEWGEYFPARLSPIPYNDTQANNLVPLDRETVLNLGWKWRDDEPEIVSTDGEGVRRCTLSGRPFKLVPQEVKFYKQMGLPEPQVHPELRQKNRLDRRNPYRLKGGQCKECSKSVWTDRKEGERIFCHDCYLAYMY